MALLGHAGTPGRGVTLYQGVRSGSAQRWRWEAVRERLDLRVHDSVALDEIDSRNMQSRKMVNLYFAGEILDLDGPIGGYNFQAAWSTGWLAGSSV